MTEYTYTKGTVDSGRLIAEIEADQTITTDLSYINDDNSGSDNLHIFFSGTLSSGEETALDAVVAAHDGTPLTVYARFCRCCSSQLNIPDLTTPTTCPVCNHTDCLIDSAGMDSLTMRGEVFRQDTEPTLAKDDEWCMWYNTTDLISWLVFRVGNGNQKKSEMSSAHTDKHKAKHVNGEDDIQNATAEQKGLATSTQIAKLDGIAAGATNKRTIAMSWASDRDVDLAVNTGAHRIPITDDGTLVIKKIRAMIGTAPTGAAIILDIHKNGTTLFTTQGNRPTIAIDGHDSGEVTNMDVTTITKGDYLTLDTDQIGSTIAGQNLVVRLDCEVTPT